ncbi:MAG: hypothetical protein RJB13_2116 [Pseudomonadota bacterium]
MDASVELMRQQIEVRQFHGAHTPTQLEWWYFTGHLWNQETEKSCESADVDRLLKERIPEYAIQSTFFLSDKTDPKGLLAHSAEAELAKKTHRSSEKFTSFSQLGSFNPLAFAKQNFLNITLGHWRLTQLGNFSKHLAWDLRFDVKGTEYLLHLSLPKNQFWYHGKGGFLKKTATSGNFYYTHPRVFASGQRVGKDQNGAPVIERVCGQLWFDHEVHVQSVMNVGWKWFGLSFTNGQSLMLYQIAEKAQLNEAQGELWDAASGKVSHLKNVKILGNKDYCTESKHCFPQEFKVTFNDPASKTENVLTVESRFEQQLMDNSANGLGRPYWEGSVSAHWSRVYGEAEKTPEVLKGIGFLEQVP